MIDLPINYYGAYFLETVLTWCILSCDNACLFKDFDLSTGVRFGLVQFGCNLGDCHFLFFSGAWLSWDGLGLRGNRLFWWCRPHCTVFDSPWFISISGIYDLNTTRKEQRQELTREYHLLPNLLCCLNIIGRATLHKSFAVRLFPPQISPME